jgi:hypothetical protein
METMKMLDALLVLQLLVLLLILLVPILLPMQRALTQQWLLACVEPTSTDLILITLPALVVVLVAPVLQDHSLILLASAPM